MVSDILKEGNWFGVFNLDDTNELVDNFYRKITSAIDKASSLKNVIRRIRK